MSCMRKGASNERRPGDAHEESCKGKGAGFLSSMKGRGEGGGGRGRVLLQRESGSVEGGCSRRGRVRLNQLIHHFPHQIHEVLFFLQIPHCKYHLFHVLFQS